MLQQLDGGLGDHGAGRVDRQRAGRQQLVDVGGGDDPAHHDGDVVPAQLGKLAAQLGHEGEMARGQRRHPHHVHVGLHRLTGHFGRGGEQRSHIHVESEVGEGGGDHLLASVVPVLADLRHQDAGAPAAPGRELVHPGPHSLDRVAAARIGVRRLCLGAVHALH